MQSTYDVIIIGGRPAGASLAIRLAKAGLSVLVVERATFPSRPSVPSMPLLPPHTVHMLDEIGIDEETLKTVAHPLHRMILNMGTHFESNIDFAAGMPDLDPNCVYSIQRDTFDNVIWNTLADHDNIDAVSNHSATGVLKDGGRVTGLTVRNIDTGEETEHTAKVVVGADGRFSFMANQVGAEVVDEDTEYNTDFYFAYWRNLDYDHEDGTHTMHVYSSVDQWQVTIFPVSETEAAVGFQQATGKMSKESGQSMEDFYEQHIHGLPIVAKQLDGAERVSKVWGIKRVGNGYREVAGPGWALTGDAVHFKDSIDAQGIYDAMLTSKLLASVITDYHAGDITWEQAQERYKQEIYDNTWHMFQETLGRLQREIYDTPPPPVLKTVLRWVMDDPIYQKKFLSFIARQIDPEGWASPSLMGGAMLRGIGRDMRNALPGASS